jgi:hypothetical protein
MVTLSNIAPTFWNHFAARSKIFFLQMKLH